MIRALPNPIKLPKGKPQKRETLVAWFAQQLAGIKFCEKTEWLKN